jgi:hypothetical protein
MFSMYFWNREASSSIDTVMKILMSSANMRHSENVSDEAKLLIRMMKSRGSRVDP